MSAAIPACAFMQTRAIPPIRAPFPWFGGKSRVAHLVWDRFGDVPNYVEPFAGSLAVLLSRPTAPRVETVNDVDCYVSNFWRAVSRDPEEVAAWADWPVNEADLHARHRWLVDREGFRERMKTDPDFFDAKVAGWWVWGISQWIGSGWCSAPEWRGRMAAGASRGIHTDRERRRPSLQVGQGVQRKRPRLGGHNNAGVCRSSLSRQVPQLGGNSGASGSGVHASGLARKAPKADRGTVSRLAIRREAIIAWFAGLKERLRNVRVCCGDWKRIVGPAPTTSIGLTGVFLDPPYDPRQIAVGSADGLFNASVALYAEHAQGVSAAVRDWAIEHGDDPKLRIALCGYEGEHEMPSS